MKIYDSGNLVQIELARQTLENADIDAVVLNKKDRLYGFGEDELYVSRDMVIKSKKILKEFDFE